MLECLSLVLLRFMSYFVVMNLFTSLLLKISTSLIKNTLVGWIGILVFTTQRVMELHVSTLVMTTSSVLMRPIGSGMIYPMPKS